MNLWLFRYQRTRPRRGGRPARCIRTRITRGVWCRAEMILLNPLLPIYNKWSGWPLRWCLGWEVPIKTEVVIIGAGPMRLSLACRAIRGNAYHGAEWRREDHRSSLFPSAIFRISIIPIAVELKVGRYLAIEGRASLRRSIQPCERRRDSRETPYSRSCYGRRQTRQSPRAWYPAPN